MRLVFFTCLIAFVSLFQPGYAANNIFDINGYLGFRFGFSKTEIENNLEDLFPSDISSRTELLPISSTINYIDTKLWFSISNESIFGLPTDSYCNVNFILISGKLSAILFTITDEDLPVNSYSLVKEFLIDEYGQPTSILSLEEYGLGEISCHWTDSDDDSIWLNIFNKKDPENGYITICFQTELYAWAKILDGFEKSDHSPCYWTSEDIKGFGDIKFGISEDSAGRIIRNVYYGYEFGKENNVYVAGDTVCTFALLTSPITNCPIILSEHDSCFMFVVCVKSEVEAIGIMYVINNYDDDVWNTLKDDYKFKYGWEPKIDEDDTIRTLTWMEEIRIANDRVFGGDTIEILEYSEECEIDGEFYTYREIWYKSSSYNNLFTGKINPVSGSSIDPDI